MTPIEEMLKISQNLEQILENQYGAVGRGLREKVDSVANQLPEDTVQKIGKLAAMRNKAAHENIALANEKIAAYRRIAGEAIVSLLLYRPFEVTQTAGISEVKTPVPESPSQEPSPLWKENENFSWDAFYSKLLPDAEQYLRQRRLYYELLKDYSSTSPKVQETISQMLSAIEKLYGLYGETHQRRQIDLQTLIDDGCRSDSPLMIAAQIDIDKLKSEMIQLQPDNSAQGFLKYLEIIQEWLQPGIRKVLTIDGINYAFRWCPPGEFMMGSPSSEEKRVSDETQHRVKLTKGFWLLETEVTQEMWQSVMGQSVKQQRDKVDKSLPLSGEGPNYPMYYVSWDDCQSFCQKLSQKLGQQVKLPTEAQWEYACRAGTTGDYAGNLDEMAWYRDNSGSKTHAVGQKKPNAWGLYDMHGNVFEWCSDYYDKNYYSRSPSSDPENTTPSPDRVFRGGGWYSSAGGCRSAPRSGLKPGRREDCLGLRVLSSPAE